MRYSTLGKTDIKVSEICLGSMTWGTQNTSSEGHAQIDHALDAGVTFMDTAEMYPVNPVRPETAGGTETIIGEYFARSGKRKDWVLATKIAGPGFFGPEEITPTSLENHLEASLKRLQTDYVDLYQLHWPNRGSYHFRQHWTFDPSQQPSKEQILDNMRAVTEKMAELQAAGKVRAFGASNESAWGMANWLRVAEETGGPRMETIQNEYSLLCRMYDNDLGEMAVHEQFTLLAYSCLGCGLLTGKYNGGTTIADGTRLAINGNLGGRTSPQTWAATQAYVDVATKHGLDPTAMAIAWTLTRPFKVMPIIGGTSVEQLKKSIDGATLELSGDVLGDITAAYRANALPF